MTGAVTRCKHIKLVVGNGGVNKDVVIIGSKTRGKARNK